MHETMRRLYKAVYEVAGVTGQTAVGLVLNESPQTVKNWETRGVSSKGMMKAQTSCGINSGWIETGSGEMLLKPTSPEVVKEENNSGHIIPIFNAEASMGFAATIPDHDTVIGGMRLNSEWVRRNVNASSINNLAVLSAYGDSMSPTFNDGDLLLVDTGIHEIKVDGVYVMHLNDGLLVKRIQRRIDGAIIIKSDNSLYDPQTVENGDREFLRVLGRVLWAWNGRKL